MDSDGIDQLIAAGQERRSVEFKQAGAWTDTHLRAKIIRGVISLANTRDGGVLVVGMKNDPQHMGYHVVDPLTAEQQQTFDPDDVIPQVNAHVAPFLSLSLLHHTAKGGGVVVVFAVDEFRDYPAVCIRDVVGSDPTKPVVKRGAILIRSARTPETAEIQSYDDLRELIELSVDKALITYFRRQRMQLAAQEPADDARFRAQLGDFAS